MSSLLDILQKKNPRPASGTPAGTSASDDPHMQTVELHLAVDNRGTADQQEEDDTAQMAAVELPIEVQDEIPALALKPEPTPRDRQPQADAAPDLNAEPLVDPLHSPDTGSADATQSFLLDQRKLRIRRNTSLLVGGLILILLVVTTAISIILQYSADRDGEQSVVISPEALQSVPAEPDVSDPPESAAVRPLRKEVTSKQAAATGTVAAARNPDWYDTPAIEPEANNTQILISRGTTENPLFPKLSEAWNAFQAADYTRAEALYREVQAADVVNVDAMLGLAAIALRSGRAQEAQSLYNAVLQADPQNSAAIAALSTLPVGTARNGDTGNESRLKNLLREQPGAAELHFALGLQYVGSGRWPEAQQAFFEAARNEPANADYAYNLAVSLDQLGQTAAAAAYYDRALSLANVGVLFDTTVARQRLDSLRTAAQ
jgi:tetratricopeptide (TPR) repeat protein